MKFGDFYHTCFQHYRLEFEDAEALYQRLNPLLATQAVLWAVLVTVSRVEVFRRVFDSPAFTAYCSFQLVAALTLGGSLLLLFAVAFPRQYSTLASLGKWASWKEDYARFRAQSAVNTEDTAEMDFDAVFEKSIISAMLDAQVVNARINERRRRFFKYAVFLLAIGTVSTFCAGILQFAFSLWRVMP